ncbi:DNA polymerase IV, partial [Streptomyces sp. SID5926]|nr:DNA polymerase IV [Streptomyces sp. SID5926]
ETPYSEVGRVRTFPVDDPELTPADPLPLVAGTEGGEGGQGGQPSSLPLPASLPKSWSGGGGAAATSRP